MRQIHAGAEIKLGYSLSKMFRYPYCKKPPLSFLRKVGAYMRSSIMLLRTGVSPGLLIETFFDIRWALFP